MSPHPKRGKPHQHGAPSHERNRADDRSPLGRMWEFDDGRLPFVRHMKNPYHKVTRRGRHVLPGLR